MDDPEPPAATRDDAPVRLGVSACLMGDNVRFDGGHKWDPFLVHTLGRFVEWVHVCPEVEFGLGTPRETLQLVQGADGARVVAPRSGTDHTEGLRAWSAERVAELAALNLHGFVLKKNSPSCGLFRVNVHPPGDGAPTQCGRGVFADTLARGLRLLPLEEEGRLADPGLRENFVERIFAYRRFRRLVEDHPTPSGLVRFHTEQKYALLAHSPAAYRELGRIVARAGTTPWAELEAAYGAGFMAALGTPATRGKQANVLQHLAGHLKHEIDAADRAELAETIDAYRSGLVPLAVPLDLLRHHFGPTTENDRAPERGRGRESGRMPKHERGERNEWARRQVYLNPYPRELMLQIHV